MLFGPTFFYSAIQAELKAQYPDQQFVNRVCQTKKARYTILEELYPIRKQIRPKKMLNFIVVCEILSQRLTFLDLDDEDLTVSAKLLQDRYNKVMSDPVVLGLIPNQMAEWRSRLEDFSYYLVDMEKTNSRR